MKIAIVSIQTSNEKWFSAAIETYIKKIKPMIDFEMIEVRSPSKGARDDAEKKKSLEGDAILKKITTEDWVVLCDESGELMNTVQVSKKFQSWLMSGRKRIVFVIGGAFGVSEQVRKRANWTWSFSPLVYNHFVAQTVLLEQVYRMLTIWKGIPYHNE